MEKIGEGNGKVEARGKQGQPVEEWAGWKDRYRPG